MKRLKEQLLQGGVNVFIRAIPFHYVGLLVDMDDEDIELAHASWVADSGRFADALATGSFEELEPYPGDGQILLRRELCAEISIWPHKLPREQR